MHNKYTLRLFTDSLDSAFVKFIRDTTIFLYCIILADLLKVLDKTINLYGLEGMK